MSMITRVGMPAGVPDKDCETRSYAWLHMCCTAGWPSHETLNGASHDKRFPSDCSLHTTLQVPQPELMYSPTCATLHHIYIIIIDLHDCTSFYMPALATNNTALIHNTSRPPYST